MEKKVTGKAPWGGGWNQKGKRTVWWNEAEGVAVNLEGEEGHHEQTQVKSARREREAPGEDGEEAQKSEKKSDSGGICRDAGLCENH